MTWRWLTFFSFALTLLPVVSLSAATVSGRVSLLDSRDPAVRKKKDFSGVVIWLEPASGAPPRLAPKAARMVQKNKTFTPHVLAIPLGTTVDFPNSDPIFHNAFSNYNGQVFDVGLYPPGTTRGVRFARPGVVRVFCNIHAAMSAVIVVLNTPWYATTTADGAFELSGVPPGEYIAKVFHERATNATLDGLVKRVVVAADGLAMPPITISEGGYLAIPHKNKYGKDYPPADDGTAYPSTQR